MLGTVPLMILILLLIARSRDGLQQRVGVLPDRRDRARASDRHHLVAARIRLGSQAALVISGTGRNDTRNFPRPASNGRPKTLPERACREEQQRPAQRVPRSLSTAGLNLTVYQDVVFHGTISACRGGNTDEIHVIAGSPRFCNGDGLGWGSGVRGGLPQGGCSGRRGRTPCRASCCSRRRGRLHHRPS